MNEDINACFQNMHSPNLSSLALAYLISHNVTICVERLNHIKLLINFDLVLNHKFRVRDRPKDTQTRHLWENLISPIPSATTFLSQFKTFTFISLSKLLLVKAVRAEYNLYNFNGWFG